MDVSNASLYDGGTAIAEAALMSTSVTRKEEIIISKTVRPEARRTQNLCPYPGLKGYRSRHEGWGD